MLILEILILSSINLVSTFRPLDQSASNRYRIIRLHNDSFFRKPIPNEELKLPNAVRLTGEFLLDRELIIKIAELRTFIEKLEFNRGKQPSSDVKPQDYSICDISTGGSKETNVMEINEVTLEPIKDLLCEENMLEEVLVKTFEAYKADNDSKSVERLKKIADEVALVASKFRRSVAEENILRLLRCYMGDEEDLNTVLEELQKKRALNKYLMHRLDEYINLAGKKFRVSDEHPSISEKFLRSLKDRIAAQQITTMRGTDSFVKTLALCLRYNNYDDYDRVLKENIKTIEGLEEFHDWLLDGISYIKETKKCDDKIKKMEDIVSAVVRQHPIWTPRDDHVEDESDFKQT